MNPQPEPDIGLVDRVVAKASQKQKRHFGDTPRLAVAASIALLSLALGLFLGQAQPADMSFEVAIAPHEGRIVQVVINASTARSQALLTISLADSLELSGFPEQRVVQWYTDLVEGKNLLSLPIRLLDENDSFFTVRMVHGSAEQSMRIDVRAKQSSVESFSA